jgi:hypothetical protein
VQGSAPDEQDAPASTRGAPAPPTSAEGRQPPRAPSPDRDDEKKEDDVVVEDSDDSDDSDSDDSDDSDDSRRQLSLIEAAVRWSSLPRRDRLGALGSPT